MMRLNNRLYVMWRHEWDLSGEPRLGGADDPRGGRRFIGLYERELDIEHHTVTIDTDATKNIWEWVDEEIKPHMERLRTIRPDLGLDVPYNWCKFPMPGGKLVVCEGRGNARSGAHTYPYDGIWYNKEMGLAWVGNHEDYAMDLRPWLPADNRFRGWLKHDVGMSNLKLPIRYHGGIHGASTACPGRNIIKHISNMRYTRPPREEEDMGSVVLLFDEKQAHPVRYYVSTWVEKRPLEDADELSMFRYVRTPEVGVSASRLNAIPDA